MPDRIERRGQVTPLTPRFMRFLREAMGGIALDDVQEPSQMRPDYACLSGLVVVEMKSLNEDAEQRIANVTKELETQDDWPEFLGAWPIDSVIRNMDDAESVKRKLADRIGRAIVSHLKKANKQLAAHAAKHPRSSQVRLVVVINEDHEVYDPAVVVFVIQKALARFDSNIPMYESVDAVLYLTERHATKDGNDVAHPIITVTGPAMEDSPWKGKVLDFVGWKWAQWTGARYIESDPADAAAVINSFATIEHIPDQLRRQDAWRLAYRRNPYMRSWNYEELRNHWDDVNVVGKLAFIKDSPVKPSAACIVKFFEQFTHLMEEIAHRGLPMPKFKAEPDRMMDAAKRIEVPPAGLTWLEDFFDRRNGGE